MREGRAARDHHLRVEVRGKFRSPLTVTPESVPPVPVAFRVLPSAKASVPPLIVPPAMFHEPVVLFSVSVLAPCW